jgi:NAD(P)-dependent dehydrogenase (short-subunit alcohol dehydrogenase family)
MKRPLVRSKTVLVTGCSSGIGKATADLLRSKGWHVVPSARSIDDLDALRAKGFSPVRLDVADSSSVEDAVAQTLQIVEGRLGGLVNNAGFALMGAMEDIGREALSRQMEVNFVGLQDLTNRLIPVMRDQGWGRIVNVSSVYGRISAPFVGSYCASKHAVEAASDALRVELWSTGIGVSLIEPGSIITEFRENAAEVAALNLEVARSRFGATYEKKIARRKADKPKPDFFRRPASEVAAKIHHALESSRPRRRYHVTPAAPIVAALRRFAPDAMLDALLRRQTNA